MVEEQERVRSRSRWKWWVLGWVSLLLIGAFLALRWSHRSGVQKELEAIRSAGLPADLVELNEWYTAVPATENAALVVWEAIQVHADPRGGELGTRALDRIPIKGPLEDDSSAAIADYLKANGETLEKLHAAAKLKSSRYPIDLTQGAATRLPHLSQMRKLTRLLKLEAIHHSANGRRAEAVRALESGFALAGTLRNEPIMVSEMVRVAWVSITLEGLERVLNEQTLTRKELGRLSRRLAEAEEDGTRGFFRGAAGERSAAKDNFELSFADLDQLGSPGFHLPFLGMELGGALFGLRRAVGWKDVDLKFHLENMGEFVKAATNRFPEMLAEAKEAETRAKERLASGQGKLAWISKQILPAMASSAGKEAKLTALLRCARVALAVEEYRLEHEGELPRRLEELVPEFLTELPEDPYDGKELGYEREREGYRVFALGAQGPIDFQVKR